MTTLFFSGPPKGSSWGGSGPRGHLGGGTLQDEIKIPEYLYKHKTRLAITWSVEEVFTVPQKHFCALLCLRLPVNASHSPDGEYSIWK